MNIEEFFLELAKNNVEDQIFEVMKVMSRSLREGNYSFCDELLNECPMTLDSNVLLAFLSISYLKRKHLTERTLFFGKVREIFQNELTPEELEDIVDRFQ